MSIFKRYLFSYISVTLFTCALVGLTLFFVLSQSLVNDYMVKQTEKASLAVADLNGQQETLQMIAYKLQSNVLYSPAYINRNAWFENELILDFAKYQDYTPIVSDYFFIYHRSESIFYPNGKTDFALYMQNKGVDSVDGMYDWITGLRLFDIRYGRPDQSLILFAYPVFTSGMTRDHGNATVCFLIEREDLARRIHTVAGELDGAVRVSWNGVPILTEEDYGIPSADDEITADSGAFTLSFALAPDGLYTQMVHYRKVSFVFVGLCVAVALFVASLAAYHSYRPIRTIADRYLENEKHGSEIDRIDELLRRSLSEGDLSRRQLESQLGQLSAQRMVLRRQLLLIALKGILTGAPEAHMYGVTFPHGFFCPVILANLDGLQPVPALYERLETLSDEDISFFAIPIQMAKYTIIVVSLSNKDMVGEASERIHCALSGNSESFDVNVGAVCQGVDHLHASFTQLLSDLRTAKQLSEAQSKECEPRSLPRDQLVSYIKENALTYNLTQQNVADLFGVSTRQVLSVVKAEAGYTYIEYITLLRIEEAKRLLAEANLSVAEVSAKVCYVSIPYFIKTFKHLVGVTPAQYKKSVRNT